MTHTVRERQKLLARVRRMKGQVDAIERALESDAGCEQVMHLFAGARGAMAGLMAEVVEDHVRHHLPYCAGGGNDLDNLVTACWAGQFGRGDFSLEEVGLSDPRARSPIVDEWDGLTGLLAKPAVTACEKDTPAALDARDEPAPAPSRMTSTEWFATLDAAQPGASARLTSFVDDCAELCVTRRLNKVLLVRMEVGGKALNVIGVQQNGLCEIPRSIGDAKDAFKEFAESVAAGIPNAIVYGTAKSWTVSKPGKKRLNILELLAAIPVLRQSLQTLYANLAPVE